MRYLPWLSVLLVVGCADRFVTQGYAVNDQIWFAEVRDPSSGDDETRLIVCSKDASPPCVRFLPKDLRTVAQFRSWLATAGGESREREERVVTSPPVRALPVTPDDEQSAPAEPDNPY